MKAVFIESHGGPKVLCYGDQPEPIIEPHEVKIQVKAVAINRLDTYVRAGVRGQGRQFPSPLILGGDAAGIVVEIGSRIKSLEIGQRVVVNPLLTCGTCSFCLSGEDDLCQNSEFMGSATNGSYAEYVKAPEANVYAIAGRVGFEEAAALPTVYLPVWNILIRKAQLKPWETLLVLSASAGVGTAAVQVGKTVVGAKVIATTSSQEKAHQTRVLGADHVINYATEDITQRVKEFSNNQGVDVVVDHVGAEFFEAAYRSLRPGGRYGICGVTTGYRAQLHMGVLFTKGLHIFGVHMGSKEDMRQIVTMLNQGKIKPVIHRIFPLNQAIDAHRTMEGQSFFGKLVLTT